MPYAGAALAEDRLDGLATGLGAGFLEVLWSTKLPLFLRLGEFSYRNCSLAGESTLLFMGCDLATTLSNPLPG